MLKKLLIFLLLNTILVAHPHVFFETTFQILIENNKIESLNITFWIDEMSTLIFTEKVKDINYIEEKELNFYKDLLRDIHIKYGEKSNFKINFIDSYVEDESLKIDIEIPINQKINLDKALIFSVYDTEYFYTYDYDKNGFNILTKDNDYSIKYSLKENKKKAFYFDMVYPKEFEVKFY